MNSASVQILILCAVHTEQINAQMLLQILRLQFAIYSLLWGIHKIGEIKMFGKGMYSIEDCIAFYWKIDLVYKQILYVGSAQYLQGTQMDSLKVILYVVQF
jgi:hypothetical protein